MSLSSNLGHESAPLSASEVDSNSDSNGSDFECDSPTNFHFIGSMPEAVKDFKQSLENEKHIRKFLNKVGSLPVPRGLRGDKTVEVLEKNYKLQIQTLLEEVNQLKLDKKILEKKLERSQREPESLKKIPRLEVSSLGFVDDSIMKRTLEAKNSTIRQLEFQISELKRENSNVKMRLEAVTVQMEDFCQRIADSETLKEMVEEKDEEITTLRESLQQEEMKLEKLNQELSHLRNENLTLRLRAQCVTCGQVSTGSTSFAIPQCSSISKDLSFYSSVERYGHHQRVSSEAKFVGKILNMSEIDDQKALTPCHASNRFRPLLFSTRATEVSEDDSKTSKSELNSQLRDVSVRALTEYEQELETENDGKSRRDPKKLNRIIEVKKIKSIVIEAQNKKLLSLLQASRKDAIQKM